MGKFCGECGKELVENEICSCKTAQAPTMDNNDAPTMDNNNPSVKNESEVKQFDDVLKKQNNSSGNFDAQRLKSFIIGLIKSPVETMKTTLSVGEMVGLFVANAVALFLSSTLFKDVDTYYVFSCVVKITIVGFAFWYLSAVLTGFIFKRGDIDYKKLSANLLIAQTPITIIYLANIILVALSPKIAIIASVGALAYQMSLIVNSFKITFDLDDEQSARCTAVAMLIFATIMVVFTTIMVNVI